jgi:hypothetical protein
MIDLRRPIMSGGPISRRALRMTVTFGDFRAGEPAIVWRVS